MKANKKQFDALFRKLQEQPPSKPESLKTGEKRTSVTIMPAGPLPLRPKPQR
jgi:hypothetical protein